MQEAFGEFVPGVYAQSNLHDAPHFQYLREHMRFAPPFKGSCAVVGSSSSLLKSADGALIDSADTVVRINSAPNLQRYAAYTGNRTDVFVTHFDKHVHNTVDLIPPTVFYCISATMSRMCWDRVREDGMYRVGPRFIRRVRQSHGLMPWPSTGFIAFELANVLCDEVRAYGFGIDPLFSNCSHYYNVDRGDPARCTKDGLEGWARGANMDHHTYVLAKWHDLGREAMLMRDHYFTLAPKARAHQLSASLAMKKLRKLADHNKSQVLRERAALRPNIGSSARRRRAALAPS